MILYPSAIIDCIFPLLPPPSNFWKDVCVLMVSTTCQSPPYLLISPIILASTEATLVYVISDFQVAKSTISLSILLTEHPGSIEYC
jgi:hypothetical protein